MAKIVPCQECLLCPNHEVARSPPVSRWLQGPFTDWVHPAPQPFVSGCLMEADITKCIQFGFGANPSIGLLGLAWLALPQRGLSHQQQQQQEQPQHQRKHIKQ